MSEYEDYEEYEPSKEDIHYEIEKEQYDKEKEYINCINNDFEMYKDYEGYDKINREYEMFKKEMEKDEKFKLLSEIEKKKDFIDFYEFEKQQQIKKERENQELNKNKHIKHNIKMYENNNKIYKFTKKDIEGIEHLKGVYDGVVFGGILPYDVENIILSYVKKDFKNMIMQIKPIYTHNNEENIKIYSIRDTVSNKFISSWNTETKKANCYKFNNIITLKKCFIYFYIGYLNKFDCECLDIEIMKIFEYIFKYNYKLIDNLICGNKEYNKENLYNKPFKYIEEYNKNITKNYKIIYECCDCVEPDNMYKFNTSYINVDKYERIYNILNNDNLQLQDIYNFIDGIEEFEEMLETIEGEEKLKYIHNNDLETFIINTEYNINYVFEYDKEKEEDILKYDYDNNLMENEYITIEDFISDKCDIELNIDLIKWLEIQQTTPFLSIIERI